MSIINIGIGLWASCIAIGVTIVLCSFILRLGVSLYNAVAGGESSPSGVPQPTSGRAILIVLLNFVCHVMVTLFMTLAANSRVMPAFWLSLYKSTLATIVISFLTTTALLVMLLPTSFLRALLVTLCYLLIMVIVVVAIAVIAVFVFGYGRVKV